MEILLISLIVVKPTIITLTHETFVLKEQCENQKTTRKKTGNFWALESKVIVISYCHSVHCILLLSKIENVQI